MPSPPSYVRDLIFVPGEPPVLYAATAEGLYRSTDGAQTLQRAAGPLGTVNVGVLAFGQEGNRTILYAATTGGMTTGTATQASDANGSHPSWISTGVYRFTSRQYRVYLPLIHK